MRITAGRARRVCAAGGLALLLAVTGCAGDEQQEDIQGQLSLVPAADDAKTLGDAAGGGTAQNEPAGDHEGLIKGDDPAKGGPKVPKGECARSIEASNALLTKHVMTLFPAKNLRRIERMKPADTMNCDPAEGPDWGGIAALWKGMTGAEAIEILAKAGWTRKDPASGPPAWATDKLKPGNGDLNLEPDPKFVVTFTATKAGKKMWIDLTQDGMRTGIE
ncbi:hypothetical protein GCM10009547_09160 [Sporichthya brevicatena]|uniref:Lipoprotein n=1 Tax=Sporichthya brevicatena TaxID=171442 RepID=A0ABN1GDJ7_9ACTN